MNLGKPATKLIKLWGIALLFGSYAAYGEQQLTVGDTFPGFSALDQHGAAYTFDKGTRKVLIAFDMAGAKQANKSLAQMEPGFLAQHGAVYISNIHGMPGIGRVFAFRKMRKYPHRIVLADDKDLLGPFPRRENHVTVIYLNEDEVIERIEYWNPVQEGLDDYVPP